MTRLDEAAKRHCENVHLNGCGCNAAFQAGYRAALKEAARVASEHAMENGPTHVYTMGGHKIAEKIRSLAGESTREG